MISDDNNSYKSIMNYLAVIFLDNCYYKLLSVISCCYLFNLYHERTLCNVNKQNNSALNPYHIKHTNLISNVTCNRNVYVVHGRLIIVRVPYRKVRKIVRVEPFLSYTYYFCILASSHTIRIRG